MPIGIGGAVLAVICAIVAGVALAGGAAGVFGGALGVWIVGMLLSLAASFASLWAPVIVSGAALVVALVLGGIIHAVLLSTPTRMPVAETTEADVEAATAPTAKPRAGVQTSTVPAVAS
ncbi:hypothetical protein DY023_17645 [Microbacterium bovistercoris]|uniref:Uncharacterized protein n=1 Tax=Microbacterium bovistercoris TaxID=2293570 RepID=A0A371NPK8_9MICO|nr:hypothetical protein [Microbacterium bovistercoris]REJ04122.1 hypothetical protein DY023_17645 [Microbacterium bovistercoris]